MFKILNAGCVCDQDEGKRDHWRYKLESALISVLELSANYWLTQKGLGEEYIIVWIKKMYVA